MHRNDRFASGFSRSNFAFAGSSSPLEAIAALDAQMSKIRGVLFAPSFDEALFVRAVHEYSEIIRRWMEPRASLLISTDRSKVSDVIYVQCRELEKLNHHVLIGMQGLRLSRDLATELLYIAINTGTPWYLSLSIERMFLDFPTLGGIQLNNSERVRMLYSRLSVIQSAISGGLESNPDWHRLHHDFVMWRELAKPKAGLMMILISHLAGGTFHDRASGSLTESELNFIAQILSNVPAVVEPPTEDDAYFLESLQRTHSRQLGSSHPAVAAKLKLLLADKPKDALLN